MGASGTRRSLRPLNFMRVRLWAQLGQMMLRERGGVCGILSVVIPGCAEGAGPESIATIVSMDSGLALRAPSGAQLRTGE